MLWGRCGCDLHWECTLFNWLAGGMQSPIRRQDHSLRLVVLSSPGCCSCARRSGSTLAAPLALTLLCCCKAAEAQGGQQEQGARHLEGQDSTGESQKRREGWASTEKE